MTALVHDRAVLENPDLVKTVTAAARLANPRRCAGVMRRALRHDGKHTTPVVSLAR